MARLSLTLLGGFQARLDPGGAASLPTKKAQALLAYLALPLGRAHPRDKLAALLWGGIREESARNSLRQAIFALRKALTAADPASLRLDGDLVALDPAAVEVDVVAFERAAAEATPAELERAAVLYQGDFLAGLAVDEAPFEEWLLGERERLRELALEGLAKLLAHQRKAGATDAAIQTAIKLLTLDPLQEPVHRTLMRLYAEERRRGAALRQYQTCVAILQRELGVEPEAETKALYQETLRQRPSDRTGGREPARQTPRGARGETVTTETPLIGRDVELATLGTMLAEAGSGRGRVVAILGEAGVGKSRLLTEVATEGRGRGHHVLFGRSYESAQILPFGPWVDAFRTGGLIAEDGLLSGLNPIWRAELARLFPELGTAGLPAASDDYLRLFESVAALVGHVASTKPLVLMLEDLHWADEMSLRLLSFLGRRVPAWPVLMVATAREEELADAGVLGRALGELRGEGHFGEVVLAPLSRPDASRLVQLLTVAGSEARAVARLEEQVWAASEGNPFVVVETVRALGEGLPLRESANLSLPQRVRDVIAGRVERLSERSRQLLSVAAVIGREFDFALLQRASRLTERDAAGSVEELVRRRMLHGVDEGFDFTHDRVREVVYGGLLPPRRKLLHGDVGAALEELTVGALDPPAAALGMHYRRAEAWEKAVLYLRQAGLKAAARSAHRDAVACFEQALEALRRLPERRETLEEAVDLRYDLRNALLPLADHAAIFEHLDAADALARRLGDDQRLGRVACYRCLSFSATGEHEQAIAAGHRALVLSTAAGVFDVKVVAQAYLGMAYYAIGDFPQALEFSQRARASLTGERRYARFGQVNPPAISSSVHVAWSLAELGDFAEGSRVAEEAVALAETTEQRYSVAAALRGAGLLYRRQGELPRAIAALERGLELCQSADVQIFLPQIASMLATAYVLAERTAEAAPLLDRMLERVVAGARFLNVALVLAELSEALILAGRVDDASPLVGRLLEMSRTHPARGYHAHARRLQGELAGHRDPPEIDQAATHYREALALAEPSGMRPLVAHCHLGLGKLYRRLGKGEEMEQHLRTATTMYREMGMQFWLGQAEAEAQEQRPGVSGARRAGRAPV